MFQNTYQNGNYFDLYDPKISQQKLKNIYRLYNVHGNNKIYDKDLKTYVLQFNTTTSKISFPKEQKKDLYLIQQYLTLQLYPQSGMNWSIQLVIRDLMKTKRRIIISPSSTKIEIKPFFIKMPSAQKIKQGIWNTVTIDLYSFMEAFKGQTYRSLDSLCIGGCFKLKRIFTSSTKPINIENPMQSEQDVKSISLLPKECYLSNQIQHYSALIRYENENYQMKNNEIQGKINTEKYNNNINSYNFKNNNNNRTTKSNKSNCKYLQNNNIQTNNLSRQRKFLANTNKQVSSRIYNNHNKKQQYYQSSQTDQNNIIEISNKNIKTKINLTKTQQIANRKSQEKKIKNLIDKKQKQKIKAKLNPWKSKNKQIDFSHCQSSKQSEIQSNLINKKKNLININNEKDKFSQLKSDNNYSDSQYFELSQKFSTFTDIKHEKPPKIECKKQNEQIQQNIEMQTNSMYESTNKKVDINLNESKLPQIITSFKDSLDNSKCQIQKQQYQQICRNSYYGFGENLLNNYIKINQRSYSPPLIENQHSQFDHQFKKNHNSNNNSSNNSIIDNNCNKYSNQKINHNQLNLTNDKSEQVELMYDPILNCYYDHKTHNYYELKK